LVGASALQVIPPAEAGGVLTDSQSVCYALRVASHPSADRLGTDPLGPLILRFSLPVIAMLVVSALYNLVDRVFVGRGVGPTALAAITISFPCSMIASAVALLFGSGAVTAVSIALGRGDRARAEASASAALAGSIAAGVLTVAAGLLLLRPMLVLFGGEGEVLVQAERFTAIWLAGTVFQIVGCTLVMAMRGAGAPAAALWISLVGTAVNLVLNPLFIFGLHAGVAGSALATTLAQGVGLGMAVLMLRRPGAPLAFRVPRLAELGLLREIVALGAAPCCMLLAMTPIIVISNNAVAAHGGPDGIAMMGILYVIYSLILLPLDGLTSGLAPVLGYNHGAGLVDRVRRALGIAVVAATAFCAAAWIPMLVFARPLVQVFVGEGTGLSSFGPGALRTFFVLLPVVGVQVMGASYFQAVGKPGLSLLNNLLRQVIILLPLLLVLPRALGLDGVWLANPISDAASATITGAFVLAELRRLGGTTAAPRRSWGWQSPSRS
jgi:putative MATE family efflux protein